jgi:hypothetical protein
VRRGRSSVRRRDAGIKYIVDVVWDRVGGERKTVSH